MATNIVILNGRLIADPELAKTKNDKSYCKFTLAVDKQGKDAGASFITCVAWDKRAETISQYVKKGNRFQVIGRLDQTSYEKDGKKQSFLNVIVDNFDFLESKKSEEKTPSEEFGLFEKKNKVEKEEIDLSSIPF